MPPLIDQLLVSTAAPTSAYMWPEPGTGRRARNISDPVFVFQYWPESLTDTENPRWAEKEVPGASHPLYQWTGGGERLITFTAVFTAEVDDEATARLGAVPGGSALLPSARYTVDINAAIARLKMFQRGEYVQSAAGQSTKPPQRLRLVLDGTALGGDSGPDVLVILKQAPVTYEAWFPNGKPRVATVQLSFAEVIQHSAGEGSQITYLGRSSFQVTARDYSFRGTVDRVGG